MFQFVHLVASFSIEFDHKLVEFEKGLPVGHCEEGDFELFGSVVEFGLHVDADGACALV